jgi:RND family efflux transporter MFP subunit
MSASMWAWRVIVPGLGLLASSLILRESYRPEPSTVPGSTARARPERSTGRVVAEGRIIPRPGAEVTVASESGGSVLTVRASERSRVHKGDVLVEFRPDELQFALAEAEAKLAEADAEVSFCQGEYSRKSKSSNSTSPPQFVSEVFASRRDLDVALARRRAADVAANRARSALARSKVVSPIDGVVIERFVEAGGVAAPGARLATICDLARLRVEAEVDEFDVSRIAEGDAVVIKAEGSGATSWKGKVEEIPDRVAGRTLIPDDPGRPTDTRVLLVKIALDAPIPLKLGQQVEVEIQTRR